MDLKLSMAQRLKTGTADVVSFTIPIDDIPGEPLKDKAPEIVF